MNPPAFSSNAPPTPEIYTLSLHDALPIFTPCRESPCLRGSSSMNPTGSRPRCRFRRIDRKSTRLNSSHEWTSYAVFCLKKKSLISAAEHSGPHAVRRNLADRLDLLHSESA